MIPKQYNPYEAIHQELRWQLIDGGGFYLGGDMPQEVIDWVNNTDWRSGPLGRSMALQHDLDKFLRKTTPKPMQVIYARCVCGALQDIAADNCPECGVTYSPTTINYTDH